MSKTGMGVSVETSLDRSGRCARGVRGSITEMVGGSTKMGGGSQRERYTNGQSMRADLDIPNLNLEGKIFASKLKRR